MLLVGVLGSPGVTRLLRYCDPVRLPTMAPRELWIPHTAFDHDVAHVGSPRFLDLSLSARRPPLPRKVERLHAPVASSSVLASPFSGRLATFILAFRGLQRFAGTTAHTVRLPRLCRRDYSRRHSGSYMLTGGSHGDLLPITRETRLGLAHQRRREPQRRRGRRNTTFV